MKRTAFLIILGIMVSATALTAQTKDPSAIEITGEGIVKIVPDEALIKIRVEHTGHDTKVLKDQNDAVINRVLRELKTIGVAEKDVRTEYLNLNKTYDYESKNYIIAANQALTIHLRDLSKYERVMRAVMDSGINRIDGVEFLTTKQEALESQARIKAIKHAKLKAEEYAAAIDQTIGKAISISEMTYTPGPGPVLYKMAAMEDSSSSGPGIAIGEMEIKTLVTVRFLLN